MVREGEGQDMRGHLAGARGMTHDMPYLLKRYERGNADATTSKGMTHHVHHVYERHGSNANAGRSNRLSQGRVQVQIGKK